MPTIALGGGVLLLLDKVHDLLGRTSEMAGLVHADAEVLWEFDQPQRVEVVAERDNPLFSKGERVPGWLFTDAEITGLGEGVEARQPAVRVHVAGDGEGRLEGVATDSLLCSTTLVHLAAKPGMASRFVRRCAAFGGPGA